MLTIDSPTLRALASLGVPGIAVGLFYYALTPWVEPGSIKVSPEWGGPIVLLIVLFAGAITFRALSPRPEPPPLAHGPVSISVAQPMRFQTVAEIVAGADVVQFLGFSQAELDFLVPQRQYKGEDAAKLLARIGEACRGGVRLYSVDASTPGSIVLTIR
ncbi:hypothetical protein FXN65_13215 [Metapseudomonas lalkuanensis]|uniref:Uncharacterized protein n=1 Tax=Metapseudomonas lalkuanensis TaxID=2604832 RepID=A0A5J6QQG3_9GAMM|nr:hypothetical protein [Pseudomonas lalkuanensis]QEY62986.1 hypothetical protein FXN65_13215 [Pseudomonas lalkuanensis]